MGRPPGRPPLGKQAMSGAERQRRYLDRLLGVQTDTALRDENALLKARIAELEAGQQATGALRIRGENARLNAENAKLKAALAQDPDSAKLRKDNALIKGRLRGIEQELKKVAKERDQYRARVGSRKWHEAKRLITRQNYAILVNAVHSDRAKHVTPAELATAERMVIALRPLFDED